MARKIKLVSNFDYAPSEVEAITRELEDLYARLDKSVEVIFSGCEGESIEALKEVYGKLSDYYESLISYCQNISAALKTTADEIREADRVAAGCVNKFSN